MKLKDDFDWSVYTLAFSEKELFGSGYDLIIEDFYIAEGELVFNDNIHPNCKELYHQVHKLNVKSVHECGFGAGNHLINLYKINDELDINGCDYCKSQMDLGIKRFNLDEYAFFKKLQIKDFSLPLREVSIKHDLVYTQAVTMHLSYDKAKEFLKNMRLISTKYIFLIENIKEHDYDGLIAKVFPDYQRISTSKYINYGILLIKPD